MSGGIIAGGGIAVSGGTRTTGGTILIGGTVRTGGTVLLGGVVASGGAIASGGIPSTGGTGTIASGGSSTGGTDAGGSTGTAAADDRYFVGGAGASDSNPGTSAQPFATISKCASVAQPGDTCHINAGVYRETVVPTNSGTATASITFAAVAGATVTMDGTDPVTGWTVDSGSIYKATIQLSGTAAKQYSATQYPPNSELWANQVFTGTTMIPEAAFPAPSTNIWAQSYTSFSSTRSVTTQCIAPPCTAVATGTLKVSNGPAAGDMTGAVAYFAGGWVALSADITGGTLNGTMNISFPVSDSKVYPGGGNDGKVRVVGKKTLLTAENEWYYDPGTTTLYLWVTGGGAPSNVFAKKRNYAFDLRGKSYINISNVTLFATTITTDDMSSNDTFDGIRGQYLSHWQTAQYDTTLPFAGIYDANHRFDSGILLHGTNNTLKNSVLHLSAGNGVNLLGSGHTVQNCTIYDVSYGGTYTAAVTIEVGTHDSKVLHNTLYNTGRDVINFNTNLYPNPGYKNNEIGFNNIYGYARTQFDLGGIYSCCDTSHLGSRFHHNWIHDPVNAGNGIHLDNGTYDVAMDHNYFSGLKGAGIHWGGHTNRPPPGSSLPYLTGTVYNNTFVMGTQATIDTYFAYTSQNANMTLRNNVFDGAAPPTNAVADHNFQGDPGLSADGTLTPGSAAINAGVAIPGITTDVTDGKPDEGAFEFGLAKWVAGSTVMP
jgi:hypothetical protein